ncbi:hypothetical protein FB451DRAFT_1528887 [Mycena latifolia]|nr:hypothetical protein FB451DRAFT_1528887 [Mycena latifolia]
MSARQPFVPGNGFAPSSRPESRSANATASAAPQLHFVADPSNPLNGGGGNVQKKSQIESAENPPLNIGSLTKSNRTQNTPSRRQSLQTTTNHIPRPATSDPHSLHASSNSHNSRPGTSEPFSKPKSNAAAPNHRLQAHSLAKSHNIVAPTPLQARSTPPLFSNAASSFKTPALPAPYTPPQRIDAHGFRTSTDDPLHSQMTDQQTSPEQSREEINPDDSTIRLKTLPSQPGPHRRAFGSHVITDLTQGDEIYEVPDAEVASNGGGRNKRARSEVDEDEDDEHAHMQSYGAPAKRFKAQKHVERKSDENTYPRGSMDEDEMYHRSSSPHVQEYPPQQPRHHTANRSTNLAASAAARCFPLQYPNSTQCNETSQHSPEIERLMQLFNAEQLDLDLDARVEKYTRSVEKWKACTREEWTAGADGLTALYTKIFDFVSRPLTVVLLMDLYLTRQIFKAKNHMTEKVQLFAVCDGRLQQQTEVLADRDTLLAGAKDQLIAESGKVLKK